MGDHQSEDFKGRAKEAAGDVTGDKDLQREGKVDQGKASMKDKIDAAAEKLKNTLNREKS